MISPDYLAKVVFKTNSLALGTIRTDRNLLLGAVSLLVDQHYADMSPLRLRLPLMLAPEQWDYCWISIRPSTWYTLIIREEGSELLEHTITNGELDEGTPVEREE